VLAFDLFSFVDLFFIIEPPVDREGRHVPVDVDGWDLFSFVDLFSIIEPPVDREGQHVPVDVDGWDLFFFVKGSGVEVFVRSHICGLFEVVRHGEGSAQIGYWEKGAKKVLTGVYFRPGYTKDQFLRWLDELGGPDITFGDFNTRHQDWDPNADHNNTGGRWLKQWFTAPARDMNMVPPTVPTFRDISRIDLCLHRAPYVRHRYMDTAGCEHSAQALKLKVDLPDNVMRRRPAWKKAVWEKVGK
jgi:hypothetical protein